jgi:glucose dehydrogenase
LIWEHELPLETSLTSPTVADGLVFVGSASGWVYSLDADTGDQVSSYPIDVFGREYPIHSSPVVADGKVYIVHDNFYGEGYVTCLNTFLGLEWLNSVGANILKSPSVADGKVFVSLEGNKVNCLDADTGLPIWEFENRDDVTSSPTVADGEVYIGLEYGTIYCIDAYAGTWIWQYSTGHDVTHTAVAGGNVYIFSDKLYCLNADTGELIWDYFIGDYLTAPAVADGKVYVASNGGTVYCFGSTLEERITSLEAENAATWINFGLLPGTRINIYSEDSYSITKIETTHVWHGFRSSFVDPWSTLSEEQQTEFLTTAKWHFFVNDEEVSLDHVLRYDEKNDAMWSLYYRVFPPGYFDLNRNNKLVGEWVGMENGEWYSTIRTAELRVK